MVPSKELFHCISLLLFSLHWIDPVLAGTQFASHVSVNTPTRSFSHGVGDPVRLLGTRHYGRPSSFRGGPRPLQIHGGYPRLKPSLPFTKEDGYDNSLNTAPWHIDLSTIPLLPPSPYKVDSPDPESLWPEGLFLPPNNRPIYGSSRRSDTGDLSDPANIDPYLLEGSEAVAAVVKAERHGHLFFHDIPHIESLLANQEMRILNNLPPHKIASIRHTWPYNRP